MCQIHDQTNMMMTFLRNQWKFWILKIELDFYRNLWQYSFAKSDILEQLNYKYKRVLWIIRITTVNSWASSVQSFGLQLCKIQYLVDFIVVWKFSFTNRTLRIPKNKKKGKKKCRIHLPCNLQRFNYYDKMKYEEILPLHFRLSFSRTKWKFCNWIKKFNSKIQFRSISKDKPVRNVWGTSWINQLIAIFICFLPENKTDSLNSIDYHFSFLSCGHYKVLSLICVLQFFIKSSNGPQYFEYGPEICCWKPLVGILFQ